MSVRRSAKATTAQDARVFTDIPNIGPSIAGDLALLGFGSPAQLAGQDPYALYDRLCALTQCRQDPCVADVFIAAVRFMEGAPPHPWWHYTAERKRTFKAREGVS
ncbi:MAG: helix-hairpin-helix domain-containing protein [Gemmatimonadaceae bacterium]|nr:helix-hairpin-helix domain-containing protein [Gemmatimonadaceae bacterium]